MSRYLVVFIPMIVAMCLTGCERKITEYREHNITETEALSEQEEVDVNEQDVFAKGYNLPIIQSDMDQAEKETEEYYWARLGCMNYSPTFFGTSYPEVVDIKENDDGTVTLTVNAVCEMVLNDEAIITHELTIRESEDGSFMYMGNKILDDGINRIPVYQYRISISQSEKDKDRGE